MAHHGSPGHDAHSHFREAGDFDWDALAEHQRESIPLADAWWDLLGRPVGKRLADIGCGPGVLAAHYAALGADVLAVDLRAEALARVPRGPRIRTLVHDLEAAPLPQPVDVMVLSEVLHHAQDPGAMLGFARQSANRILVAEYDEGAAEGPPVEARLAAKRVADLLRAAGFTPGRTARPSPGQYAIVANAK